MHNRNITPAKRASFKRKVLKAYKTAGSLSATATMVGLDRSTIREWRDNDPDFAEALRQIDDITTDAVESTLVQMALDKDIVAIKYYLNARSHRYKPKPEAQNTSATIQQQFIVRMEHSPEMPATLAHPLLSRIPEEEEDVIDG